MGHVALLDESAVKVPRRAGRERIETGGGGFGVEFCHELLSNAAKQARRAWSSSAVGAPNTAMIPSPVNLSTVPPYRCTAADERVNTSATTSRSPSGPSADASCIDPTTSANNTVTCLYSACSGAEPTDAPQPSQNLAPARSARPHARRDCTAIRSSAKRACSPITRWANHSWPIAPLTSDQTTARQTGSPLSADCLQVSQIVGDVDGVFPQRLEGHHLKRAFMSRRQHHRGSATILVGP